MIDTLIKATVLLTVVALAALSLRRSSASLRHLLWTLGIVGLVAIPVFAIALLRMARMESEVAVDTVRNTKP